MQNYTPANYVSEFGQLINALSSTPVPIDISNLNPVSRARQMLIGPSVVSGTWSPEMVWNAGFVTEYSSNLAALSVQK
jgi:hypothetical protein